MESIMLGTFDKVGIIFNPLVVNHFLDVPLSSIASKGVTLFDYFGAPFIEVINRVYVEEDLNGKRELLDDFFAHKYLELRDQRIVSAVGMILNNDKNIKIQDLAKELSISRETLLRLFKKHLCCSVEDFKSTVKFRKALEYYQETSSKPKLTQVALETE